MKTIRALDIVDAMGIVPRLCTAHRAEIERSHPDLAAWARSRVCLPGPQWALDVDGQVMLIGGLIDQGDTATLWFAGAMGWTRNLRDLFRIFAELRDAGLFGELRCEVYADNTRARRLVEHVGFVRQKSEGDLLHYGMRP